MRDIASLAEADQRAGGYAVDVWTNVTLQPMFKLWQGVNKEIPGQTSRTSNFFLSEEDARQARGAYEDTEPYRFAQTLWRFAQVAPHPDPTVGFREKIAEFVVDRPVAAAVGCCLANVTSPRGQDLGSGSVIQYFIPDWQDYIFATKRTFTFSEKAYPELW